MKNSGSRLFLIATALAAQLSASSAFCADEVSYVRPAGPAAENDPVKGAPVLLEAGKCGEKEQRKCVAFVQGKYSATAGEWIVCNANPGQGFPPVYTCPTAQDCLIDFRAAKERQHNGKPEVAIEAKKMAAPDDSAVEGCSREYWSAPMPASTVPAAAQPAPTAEACSSSCYDRLCGKVFDEAATDAGACADKDRASFKRLCAQRPSDVLEGDKATAKCVRDNKAKLYQYNDRAAQVAVCQSSCSNDVSCKALTGLAHQACVENRDKACELAVEDVRAEQGRIMRPDSNFESYPMSVRACFFENRQNWHRRNAFQRCYMKCDIDAPRNKVRHCKDELFKQEKAIKAAGGYQQDSELDYNISGQAAAREAISKMVDCGKQKTYKSGCRECFKCGDVAGFRGNDCQAQLDACMSAKPGI